MYEHYLYMGSTEDLLIPSKFLVPRIQAAVCLEGSQPSFLEL